MKNIISLLLFVFILGIFAGCSSFRQNESEDANTQKEVYVFDDVSTTTDSVSAVNTAAQELPATVEEKPKIEMYLVQVGAFSTEEKAENFINSISDKIDYELTSHYSNRVNLYVVQLPPFRTKKEAEKVRDKIRLIEELKGAFIVLPDSK